MNVRRLRPSSGRRWSVAFWARTSIAGAGAVAVTAGALLGATGHGGRALSHAAPRPASPMRLASALQNEYWMVASDGGIFSFGGAQFFGSTGNIKLNKPIVGMAATFDGGGYWFVASDGGIFSEGDAGYFGSHGGSPLNQPIVAMAATPDDGGYWLVASDGGIFTYGDAPWFGSTGGQPLAKPIVGMAATPDGGGYWLVASDGGIFAFGDAVWYGSMGGTPLAKPVVGIAATPDGRGYWLVASDGGIFSFGDAGFHGSTGNIKLNQPIVGMAATQTGHGYWFVASDGGIFSFGDAKFSGSTGNIKLNQPIVGMALTPTLFPGAIDLTLSTHAIPADGTSTASLGVFVSDGSGTPVPGDLLSLSVDTPGCGSLTPDFAVSDLTGMVTATYKASSTVAVCHLTVTDGFTTSAALITQGAGAPAHVAAAPGSGSYTADQGHAGIPATFTVTDSLGHGLPGVQVDLSTTLAHASGVPASAVTDAAGHVTLSVVDTTAGDAGTVTGTAHNTALSASTGTISLIAGAVHTITVTGPSATQIAGTGYSEQVQIADTYGNAISPDTSLVTLGGTALGAAPDGTHTGSASFDGAFTGGQTTASALSYLAGSNLTLTATYGAVTGSTTVNVSRAAASSLTASPSGPSAVSADTMATTGLPLAFTLTDPYGNPVAGQSLTIATTDSGFPHASPAVPATLTTGALGSANPGVATFTLHDTNDADGGMVTATLASPSLNATTGAIVINPGAVGAIGLSAIGAQTAGTQYSVTVTARDAFGNLTTPATSDFVISGTALGTAPDGAHQGTATWAGPFAGGMATLHVTSFAAGSVTLTVTDGAVHMTSPSYTVNPAATSSVTATPSDPTYTADQGNTGIPLTFTALDAYANPVAGVTLSLGQTGLTHATFTPASPVHTGDGSAGTTLGVAPVSMMDTNATDSGTVTATVAGSSPAISGTTGTITITPGALHTLGFSAISTQVAGTQYTSTLSADDAFGNPVNPAVSAITFGGTALDAAPNASHTGTAAINGVFSGGHATVNVTSYKAESATLTAADGTVHASAGPYTVGSAVPSTITPTPSSATSVSADVGSFTVTFTGVDPYGNVGAGIKYDLTQTGLTHWSPPASPIIGDATGLATATITDTNSVDSGTVTATVEGAPAANATTATITITAGLLNSFTWSGSPTMQASIPAATAGTPFTAYLKAFDSHLNPVNPPVGNVVLSGTALATSPNGTPSSSSVGTFSNGQSAVSVTATNAENNPAALTATDTTNTFGSSPVSQNASVTINPNTFTQVVATSTSFQPTNLGTGLFFQDTSGSAIVHLTAEDDFGNTETTIGDPVTVSLAKDTHPGYTVDGGTIATGGGVPVSDAATTATLPLVLSNGTGSFTYATPASISAGTAYGVLTFTDTHVGSSPHPTSSPSSIEVTLTTVHTVTVNASPTNLTADTAATSGVTASALAVNGSSTAQDSVPIDFSTTGLAGTNVGPLQASTSAMGAAAQVTFNPTLVSQGNVFATLHGAPVSNVNLTSETPTVTVTVGALHTLTLGSPTPSTPTAGGSYTAPVTATDQETNPVTPTGTFSKSGTALGTAPDGTHTGTASVGAFTNGHATLTGTAYLAQAGATLTIQYGSVASPPATFDVAVAAPASVTPGALPSNCCDADAGNTGIPVSFTVLDPYQNPVPAQNLSLTTGLATATIVPTTAVTGSDGVASATVHDTTAGDSGSVTATVPSTAVANSTAAITIRAGALAKLTVTNPTAQTAGVTYTVTVHAADNYGNAVSPAVAGDLTCTPSTTFSCTGAALDTAPNGTAGTAAFQSPFSSNGTAVLNVTSYKAESGVALTVADGAVSKTTAPTFTVNPATATQFLVTSNSADYTSSTHTLQLSSNGETATFTMTMVDPWQNVATTHLADAIQVSLVGTDGGSLTGGGHTNGPDGPTTTVMVTVTLSGGTGTFVYQGPSPRVPTLTGTISFSDTTANSITPSPTTITVKT